MKFVKLNYEDIGMTNNRKLPKWLKVDLIENCFYFSETPQ